MAFDSSVGVESRLSAEPETMGEMWASMDAVEFFLIYVTLKDYRTGKTE